MRPLAALALAFWPVLALADGTPPGARGGVALYRGAEASVPSPIPVLRGSSAMGLPPSPPGAPPPETRAVVGGDRLWLVDEAEAELTACRLGGTTVIGRDRIGCTRRGLP